MAKHIFEPRAWLWEGGGRRCSWFGQQHPRDDKM